LPPPTRSCAYWRCSQKEEREVPKHLQGGLNCCCAGLPCRGKRPHHYLPPRWEYVPRLAPGQQPIFYHRDFAGRETAHPLTDRYLHHADGKLRTLMVACSDDIWQMAMEKRNETTWRRTYIRKMASYRTRMASWIVDYTKERNCGTYSVELLQSLLFATAMMLLVRLCLRLPIFIIKLTNIQPQAPLRNQRSTKLALRRRLRPSFTSLLRQRQGLEQSAGTNAGKILAE